MALGWTVRFERERAPTSEVALDGAQAFVHISMFRLGYQTSPAGMVLGTLKMVLIPFTALPSTHRIDHHTIIVIDGHGVRTMTFQGVSGPFQVTSDGPVVRVGNQLCRWTGRALMTLTREEGDAVQRDYTGPVRPPWSKQGFGFYERAKVISITIDGAPYQLEAHAAGDLKTLTLIDSRGARRDLWSIDERDHWLSADQFRERFR